MMVRYALALLAAPVMLAAIPAQIAHAQQKADDLKQVSAYIRAVKTMTADFTQTDRNGRTLSGKLTLKQPGKIRFEYQKDVPLLIVGDGKSLTMIDYEVSQVQRWPIRNSPLGALLDPDRDLGKYGKVVPSGDPRILMRSEEHTSELQSLMRSSYAIYCVNKKTYDKRQEPTNNHNHTKHT